MNLKIGDMVWGFDENRRTYTAGQSQPIYREHFRPAPIVGETPKTWVLGGWLSGATIHKDAVGPTVRARKKDWTWRIFLTETAVQNDIYINDNRVRIADAVRECTDVEKLKLIAATVGVDDDTCLEVSK